jgi:hypothetical protein
VEVQVSFSDGVPEKGQSRGVSRYPFMPLNDHCSPIFHGIRQLARAIVSMNLHTQALTILDIRNSRRSHRAPFNPFPKRRSLHDRDWLAGIKAQSAIQGQRSVMKRRLKQPDPWKVALSGPD